MKPTLSFALILTIAASILLALLPPLVLERILNSLTAEKPILFSAALGYFLITALSGLVDAAKESMITVFGQHITHKIRSVMSEKLNWLPSSYFIETDPGTAASLFVNDVNAVDRLFSSGIVSMAADVCKLISILVIIYLKSSGLGILLTVTTPFLFLMTRIFQKKMRLAQTENLAATAKTNQQIPEVLKNIRSIRILHQESYILHRYADSIDQSYCAQERSNFYDAVYSPIIVSVSSLLIGIVMAASAQSGAIQTFFGMSVGTAAAVIAYVGNFFDPLENIGMEIQNIQAAASGISRIKEFLKEPEQSTSHSAECNSSDAVTLSHISFRYQSDTPEILHDFSLNVKEGESVVLAGRTGAGKSTIIKLIAGLYTPEHGAVCLFGKDPCTIPEPEKRRIYGYVEQQFHLIPGTVADQISLNDPQVTVSQIEEALRLVGLWDTVNTFPARIQTPCSEGLFSQGEFQLLSIARAIVMNPKILLLDEITSNLDAQTEQRILTTLHDASQNRTMISVSHRIYEYLKDRSIRIISL